MNAADKSWMRRALVLAERGRGAVEPNPLVGAVLVREGAIIGEGWHERFGEAHAEVNALAQAGNAARGSTLYVTLEPCCHLGKTPPCTDAIIRAGITRVIAAMPDPFPKVAGRGAERLRDAGVPIDFGVCDVEARRQNAPYLKLLATGRPYVHAKWAMSLDGKFATHTGNSKWISNEASRRRVHDLRGRMDAILVGIGTALADDPMLTARPAGPRTACRVILDSKARLGLDSQLVKTARDFATLIVTQSADAATISPFEKAGCEVLSIQHEPEGRPGILELLDEMGRRRWTNLLVEGGSAVFGAFFDLDAVDEAHVFVAPKLLGSTAAKTPVGGHGCDAILQSPTWITETIENIAGDAYLRCVRQRIE